MASTAPAAAAATCTRCYGRSWVYLEAGPDEFPYQTACPACADLGDDEDGGDDCRAGDDIAASAPDDASRYAFVAAHYPAAA